MSLNGLTAKGVPPNLSSIVLPIRIAIIVLSVIILALAAYAISVFGDLAGYVGDYTGVSGLLIFVVIKTWIIFGVLWFFELRMPHLYYRIIALIAYAFSIVLWLSAWAWSASIAAFWLGTICVDDGFGNVCEGPGSFEKKEGGALAACAGLGALAWVLSIVHLFLFVRASLASPPQPSQAELGQVPVAGKEPTANVYAVPAGAPIPGPYQTQPVPPQGYAQQQATY